MSKFQPEGLYVTAQQYKLRHRLRPAAIGRWLAEKAFSQFGDRMEVLAAVDQQMRETALGRNEFNISIKGALDESKKALNAGRYIDVAYYASVVDEILIAIILQSQEVVSNIRTIGEEYSARTENPEAVDFFAENKQVEAQLLQSVWRKYLGDPMEKAYANEVRKNKAIFNGLVVTLERYVTEIMGTFDRMGMARSGGKIEDWVKEYDRLTQSQPRLHAYIDKIYEQHVKRFVQVARRMQMEGDVGDQANLAWLEKIFGGAPAQPQQGARPPPLPQEEEVINVEEGDIIEDIEEGDIIESKEVDPWGLSPASQKEQAKTQPMPAAGQPTDGVPVSPGVVEQQRTQAPETEAEPVAKRQRGRPRKEPGTLDDITEDQFAQLAEVLKGVRKEQAQIMAGVIETALRAGGGDEIIQTADGEVIAQIQNGVITFYGIEGPDGEDIQIPVNLSFKALRQMQVAGLLGEKQEDAYRRGPDAKPIPMGGEVEEEEREVPQLGPVPAAPKKKRAPKTAPKPKVAPTATEEVAKPEQAKPRRGQPGTRKGLLVSIDEETMQKLRADPKAKNRLRAKLKKLYLERHPDVKEDFSVYIAPADQIQTEVDRYKQRGTYDETILDETTYDELTSPAVAQTASDNVDRAVLKLSHDRFYRGLKQTAELNDPYLMASLMLKYSEKIEETDPELSIKLLAHAQDIING